MSMCVYTIARDAFFDAIYDDPSKRRLVANVGTKIKNPIVAGYEQYGNGGSFSEYVNGNIGYCTSSARTIERSDELSCLPHRLCMSRSVPEITPPSIFQRSETQATSY